MNREERRVTRASARSARLDGPTNQGDYDAINVVGTPEPLQNELRDDSTSRVESLENVVEVVNRPMYSPGTSLVTSVLPPTVIQHGESSGQSSRVLNTGIFAFPEKEPEHPIPFKTALEFLPKTFDGRNVPINRFINDCIYARNSIAAKDRHCLFLMVRTRVVGSAYDSLQDRDILNLEDLLRHLKITFTEHRSVSQLNASLAIVAQRDSEKVFDYGNRVTKLLTSLIDLIEGQHCEITAKIMINSVRNTACENFVIGLKRDLSLRVRVGQPQTLQEAINLARTAEWETDYESQLERKDERKSPDSGREEEAFRKFYKKSNSLDRFQPYYRNARVRKIHEG